MQVSQQPERLQPEGGGFPPARFMPTRPRRVLEQRQAGCDVCWIGLHSLVQACQFCVIHAFPFTGSHQGESCVRSSRNLYTQPARRGLSARRTYQRQVRQRPYRCMSHNRRVVEKCPTLYSAHIWGSRSHHPRRARSMARNTSAYMVGGAPG